jgi:hypothetical protein
MQCDRPKCSRPAPAGDLYCSAPCFDLDNDSNPIQPLARNKVGGFGADISRMRREPVRLRMAK